MIRNLNPVFYRVIRFYYCQHICENVFYITNNLELCRTFRIKCYFLHTVVLYSSFNFFACVLPYMYGAR